MAHGTVDVATAYMVPAFLTGDSPESVFTWAREPALAFTIAGLFTPHLALAPSPSADRFPSDLWGMFLEGLGSAVAQTAPTAEHHREALALTHRRAAQDPSRLVTALRSLKSDPNFPDWLVWHSEHEWVEHTRRKEGFFDREFPIDIAKTLNVNGDDMEQLWREARDPGSVKQLGLELRREVASERLELLVEAWLISTLLRGRYHERLAELSGAQLLRHPLRQKFDHEDGAERATVYQANQAEQFFAAIILCSPLRLRHPQQRLALYAENLRNARMAGAANRLLLGGGSDYVSDEAGLERAASEARLLARNGAIRFPSRSLARSIDIALTAVWALAGLVFDPWLAVPAGVAAGVGTVIARPGERIDRRLGPTTRKLRQLATAPAGRIDLLSR